MKYNLQDILTLMDKMSETDLGELVIEDDNTKIKIKGKNVTVTENILTGVEQPIRTMPIIQEIDNKVEKIETVKGNEVLSPIVGTFYASPSPDKPKFVTVGSKVKKGDVLFIIESMKLMNEITSEYTGIVTQILVDDCSGVEFGQPIMIIE